MLKNNAMNNKKDAFYFPHDCNAKDDPKCVLLVEQLGMEGYGIFWVLIEILREQPDYKYPLKLLPALARRYNTTTEKVRAVIECYELFVIEKDTFFYSQSLINRMAPLEEKRLKLSEAGKRGNVARWNIATRSLGDNKAIATRSQVKKNRVNKSKEEYSIGEYERETMNAESNDVSASMDTGCSAPVPHNSESFLKFQQWITDNAPRVAKMKEPMTDKQLQKLKEEYSTEQICETLQAMHNYEPLIRKNRSAYMTVTNWLRRNRRTTNNTSSHETTRKYNDL